MIGWTIATPTVGGALIGLWLNKHVPRNFSWPVALILGGLALGIFMAWGWMSRERAADDDDVTSSDITGSRAKSDTSESEDP